MSDRTRYLAERALERESAQAAKQKQREATVSAPFNAIGGLSAVREGAPMPPAQGVLALGQPEGFYGGGAFQGRGAGRSATPTIAPTAARQRVSGGQATAAAPAQLDAASQPPLVTDAHRAQADLSPEIAALKEAISAPQPVFRGLAFSKAEQAALGFLAGLRGLGAVTPIIEQRRRDAVTTYEAAREVRAERIRESQALAGIAQEQRSIKASEQKRSEDVEYREREFTEQQRAAKERERLTGRGQDIALQRARERAALRFPPGYAKAREDRRNLSAVRQEVRHAIGIIREYPGLTGPMDQSFLMHPTAEGMLALRNMESSLSTITSLMASTESGGKNLTSTEVEMFGGRFPLTKNLGATVKARLENAERWLSGKIGLIDTDFPTDAEGGAGIEAPSQPPPEGYQTDILEMPY